jgi:uncharacterized surface protein with fasciclin (FAS1) repeats
MKVLKTLGLVLIATTLMAMVPFTNQNDNSYNNSDIVELAIQTEALSTLVAAVQAADLVETLQSEGPFTVFAPTNAAFAALPDGTLESLLEEDNKAMLVDILTYHVVAGKVMSSDLSDGMTATTVQGTEITIGVGNGVTIDGANVVQADIEATNGVVHVIDAVILPKEEESSSSY